MRGLAHIYIYIYIIFLAGVYTLVSRVTDSKLSREMWSWLTAEPACTLTAGNGGDVQTLLDELTESWSKSLRMQDRGGEDSQELPI